jgi:hypothetical protein
VLLPWLDCAVEVEKDPSFFQRFAENPDKLYEFLAGAHELAGFQVELTSRTRMGSGSFMRKRKGSARSAFSTNRKSTCQAAS